MEQKFNPLILNGLFLLAVWQLTGPFVLAPSRYAVRSFGAL